MDKKILLTQLIWTGNSYEIADERNSVRQAALVQDGVGHWHKRQFPGQRVTYDRANVYFGFQVVEANKETIQVDEDGELILDGLFMTSDGNIWRAV